MQQKEDNQQEHHNQDDFARTNTKQVNPSFVVGTNPNTQKKCLPFPTHTCTLTQNRNKKNN